VTPPAATVTQRREQARKASARRRRRSAQRRRVLFWVVGLAAVAVAAIMLMPDVRKAVNDLTLPLKYQDIIREQAAAKHLDPALIAAVIDAETKYDPRTSSAGAEGLMQIEPATAEFLAHRSGATSFTTADLSEPAVNIAYGSYYLRYLLNEYDQNKMEALAAYNGGETNVDNWIAAARTAGHPFGIGDITFPQTRDYVAKVLSAQRDYRNTYPTELGYR
jgi:soluble lytic murein transglycosylase